MVQVILIINTYAYMLKIEKIVLDIVKARVGKKFFVSLDTNLKDELNFDMLDYISLEMELEKKGIHVGFTQLRDCQTVADIAMLLL